MTSLIDHRLPFRCRICGERRSTIGSMRDHYYLMHGWLQRLWRRVTDQPIGVDIEVRGFVTYRNNRDEP